jgi:hypothetical protein
MFQQIKKRENECFRPIKLNFLHKDHSILKKMVETIVSIKEKLKKFSLLFSNKPTNLD